MGARMHALGVSRGDDVTYNPGQPPMALRAAFKYAKIRPLFNPRDTPTMKTSADIRRMFLEFFERRGHTIVPSSILVPADDPTLLFTNAGMVQFKEVFLGREKRDYARATTSQRCVRAGGKHNDLENVGYTARHHTFFEMLGNFSFGDYFKAEAIAYAWEFLTTTAGLPPDRLWVTVYSEDDEAADIWLNQVGVDPNRFSRIGDKPGKRYESDNFWAMGETGPCGPCSEIFYDHGAHVAGGPPGSAEADGDRYIEIWNLVFMQFNRAEGGELRPLPRPSVDTGMGLERLAAVLQGKHDNYDIDMLGALVQAAAEVIGVANTGQKSLRVIADHIRSSAFLHVDGVRPANDGRGYVLRRIIRRAVRHGSQLGAAGAFLHKLVEPLCREMGAAYPELVAGAAAAAGAIEEEEARFAETLALGLKILEQDLAGITRGDIPGETVFRLYDTYGFPVDLTADIARERGLGVDMAGFEDCMREQRERARATAAFKPDYRHSIGAGLATEFIGYDHSAGASTIAALARDGEAVESLASGQTGQVVLEQTPFYAESGGQVGDRGTITTADALFEVADTQKQGDAIFHYGAVKFGVLRVGDRAKPAIDFERRQAIVLNHSATHLLHAALRRVLGEHVTQKGSLVAPDRLRFDFSHPDPVKPAELSAIERMVNHHIRANHAAQTRLMKLDEAKKSGAMALFGEKYADEVRVLRLSDFSVELCGGTHVRRTGDIGVFKITEETGIAAGVRRIEAVTGEAALDAVATAWRDLDTVAAHVKGSRREVTDNVRAMAERARALEKEIAQLKTKLANAQGDDMAAKATEVSGVRVLAQTVDNADAKALRETVDQLKNKLGDAAIVLAAVEGEKIRLIAGVSKGVAKKIPAGELVNMVAEQVGGRGGGRPDMAQAGGNNVAALPAALSSVAAWVEGRL